MREGGGLLYGPLFIEIAQSTQSTEIQLFNFASGDVNTYWTESKTVFGLFHDLTGDTL